MICVTIARSRHRMMIAEHRSLAQRGVPLVEFRLDYLARSPDPRRLLRDRPTPAIITCRRAQDGGRFRGAEDHRRMLLRSAIADGAEYVDLEQDVAREIPRHGPTKRIISYHNFQETPEDLEEIHTQLAAGDADIVKLATMANHVSDNVRMWKLVASAQVPTIGFCMGELGVPSRILVGKFGAPFTYASFGTGQAVAPGQVSFDELRDVYRYEQIGPQMEVYGVIGDPIGHSLSPRIHNAAFAALGMNKVYLPFQVPAEQLSEFWDMARWLEMRGLSVTIPHKEAVVPYLLERDDTVGATGAANTMVLDPQGWKGYNTDCDAALESLGEALAEMPSDVTPSGSRDAAKSTLSGKTVLVLGAGGVARAIAHGLKTHGAEVTVTNRTDSRGEQLAHEMNCGWVPWEQRGTVSADILINCTSVGMSPDTDACPMDPESLRPPLLVFDTVYNPEETKLIQEARRCGCRTVTGVEMFIRQAAAQFRLFTGQEPPMELMRKVVQAGLGTAKPSSPAPTQSRDRQEAAER